MFHVLTLRRVLVALLLTVLAGWPGAAEAAATVQIYNVAYEADRHSVVLDITGPVTIATRSLRAPARLVVDVPAATLMTKNREMTIGDGLVKRVRLSQFKIFPPTVRVVIETAGEAEPLIAVQQTENHLYITVAPPRQEEPEETPVPVPASPAPSPVVTPAPPLPSLPTPPTPTVAPTPRVTPPPVPSPVPTVMPTVRPSVAPSLAPMPSPRPSRRPEQGGETTHESLPGSP
jgi:hypothetical protein